MKNPCDFSLAEIETILKLNPRFNDTYSVHKALSELYVFLEIYIKALAEYKVQKEMERPAEVKRTKLVPVGSRVRACNSMDRDLLDACVLVEQ